MNKSTFGRMIKTKNNITPQEAKQIEGDLGKFWKKWPVSKNLVGK